MDTGNLKNIVVLKDLPSNLVEEAIVVLKENQKIPKLEIANKKKVNKQAQPKDMPKVKPKDYIIKEAQMLISEYITKLENKNKKETVSFQTLKKKYERVKTINCLLIASLAISIFVQFVIK